MFAARLPQGWQAHIAPMQDMVDLEAKPDFAKANALVFTSANAVRSFARRWAVRNLPAYCVGDATTAIAQELGLVAHSAGGDSADLSAMLASLPPQNLLYLHGKNIRSRLSVPGQTIAALPIYNQLALPLDEGTHRALAANELCATALFSPRSAALLVAESRNWPSLTCICLSAAVAALAAPLGPCLVAAQPNADALLATIGTFSAP